MFIRTWKSWQEPTFLNNISNLFFPTSLSSVNRYQKKPWVSGLFNQSNNFYICSFRQCNAMPTLWQKIFMVEIGIITHAKNEKKKPNKNWNFRLHYKATFATFVWSTGTIKDVRVQQHIAIWGRLCVSTNVFCHYESNKADTWNPHVINPAWLANQNPKWLYFAWKVSLILFSQCAGNQPSTTWHVRSRWECFF